MERQARAGHLRRKAKQLRARMRQYVNFQDERAKIPLLVEQICTFEYIVVGNEHESLVLEKNLINQHAPWFNADFKDDKSYPFIAITKGDVFPAINSRVRSIARIHAISVPIPIAAPLDAWSTSQGGWCRCALRAALIGVR